MAPGGALLRSVRNTNHLVQYTPQYDNDLRRIRQEVEALEDGASDDIFQTRGSPFGEQLPLNTAINLNEPAGSAGFDNRARDRLQVLLPVEQEVTPRKRMPHQLMEDIARHFRSIVKDIPEDGLLFNETNRDESEFHLFADRIWSGVACQFPDKLLRRVRPYVPFQRDLDCSLSKCLMRCICDEYSIPYDLVGREAGGECYHFRNHQLLQDTSVRFAIETVFLSIYVSRLAIAIAAWLPYELMMIQACNDPRLDQAFINGQEYFRHGLPLNSLDTFEEAYFHVCLGHVLNWLEHMGWFEPILWSNQDLYKEWFWAAVDQGADIWQLVDDDD
ncbi:MAG: hypothetical protein Q9200_003284 [Gallowayella weberi]